MEKSYKISRKIIAIITFVLFGYISVNEFGGAWYIVPIIFTAIAFGFSFPSTLISKKLINIGNKFENKILRVLYYIVILPFISFLIFYGIYAIVLFINEPMLNSHSSDMGEALSKAFIVLFWITAGTICVVLPYIQTLIVLVLNRFVVKSEQTYIKE